MINHPFLGSHVLGNPHMVHPMEWRDGFTMITMTTFTNTAGSCRIIANMGMYYCTAELHVFFCMYDAYIMYMIVLMHIIWNRGEPTTTTQLSSACPCWLHIPPVNCVHLVSQRHR